MGIINWFKRTTDRYRDKHEAELAERARQNGVSIEEQRKQEDEGALAIGMSSTS